jgi:predicted outer membrane repeat protein
MPLRTAAACSGLLVFCSFAFANPVIYVDETAAEDGDGSSWDRAFRSLDDALDAYDSPGTHIWVAGGIYTPKKNGDETSTFQIPEGARLFGGFHGDEDELDDRPDPFDQPSILNGDIASGIEGDIDNIVTVTDISFALLDGFVIESAGGSAASPDGGGVLIQDSSVLIRNVAIVDCFAGPTTSGGRGGGIAVLGESLLQLEDALIENCGAPTGGGIFSESPVQILRTSFQDNSAQSTDGGAIALTGQGVSTIFESVFEGNFTQNGGGGAIGCSLERVSTTTGLLVEDCVFIDNAGGNGSFGGAIAFEGDGLNRISRTRFINNQTPNAGGAVFSGVGGAPAELVIESTFFSGNRSGFRGGAVYQQGTGDLFLINTTIVGNEADGLGGGVFTAAGDCFVGNSILWDNNNTTSAGQPRQDQFSFSGGGAPRDISIGWSRVQNWENSPLDGNETTGADPGLELPLGPDGIRGTEDDSALLSPGASSIDAGNDIWSVNVVSVGDLNLQPRYVDDPGTPDTGVDDKNPGVVDIGATEFQGDSTQCPGDADASGTVDLADLNLVLANFGGANPEGDVSGDGLVDLTDLNLVLANFGSSCK